MRIIRTVLPLLCCQALPLAGKSARTYYTETRLAAMQANLKEHQWAKSARTTIITEADKWLKFTDDELRLMVPPANLPRAIYVHEAGCPKHGLAIRKFGTYPWKLSLDHPFKVQCPVGGEFYPDNDFSAYYRFGIVEGRFQPDRADRSLLKGNIVDDGWGWDRPDDDNPQKYWFVGYYTHWMLARKVVYGVLQYCSQAYLISGDERYAHKAAVVLWQLAQHYPKYRYEKQSRRGTEIDPNYRGKLRYHTWETSTVNHAALAYDAVFPHIGEDAELQRMTGQTATEIREHIESRMLRPMAKLIIDGSHTIQGNYGSHQQALLKVAIVCLDEAHDPKRSAVIQWVLNNDNVRIYTDMGLNDALFNVIFRDGVPFESPSYNQGWIKSLLSMATMLHECGVDIFSRPRLKKLCDWPIDMTCCGRFTPALGDSGNMYHPAVGRSGRVYGPAYRQYGDTRHAKLYAGISGVPSHDLFEECVDDEIAQAANRHQGELGTDSFLFPAYGMSILQTGGKQNRTALMLHQGSGRWAHAHYDAMHIDLYSWGYALIPDFGYPETCNSQDPRRFGYFSHTLAHNTVMVNETRGERADGQLTAYDAGSFCQVVEARAEGVYPGVVSRYQRTLALIEITPSNAYVVDAFRVKGGRQHDWIVHGTGADFASDLDLTQPRADGTLAGPDVEYGHFYDDRKLAAAPYGGISYQPYKGSAFMYLFNVQTATLPGHGTASWQLKRQVALRTHLIGADERVYICDGKPQQNTKTTPETVKFLLRRRTGDDLESTFVTVFEPYKGNPVLRSVTRLPGDESVVALRIVRADGGVDYYLNALDETKTHKVGADITFQAQSAVISLDAQRRVIRAHLTNGGFVTFGEFVLRAGPPCTARIAALDYRAGSIVLDQPVLKDRAVQGRWVVVSNERHSTMYRIDEVVAKNAFSIRTQDTRCGRLLPVAYDAEANRITTSNFSYFTRPGMYIADEDYRILGQIASVEDRAVVLDPATPVALDRLPDADQDGRSRLWVLDFAPGDTVKIPTSATYQTTE